jgi:hypothetical protein
MPNPNVFAPNSSFLNPKFETYRLSLPESLEIRRYPLPGAQTGRPIRAIEHERVGWNEVRAKARWNHLSLAEERLEVAWVDSEGEVWTAKLDEVVILDVPAVLKPKLTLRGRLVIRLSSRCRHSRHPWGRPPGQPSIPDCFIPMTIGWSRTVAAGFTS